MFRNKTKTPTLTLACGAGVALAAAIAGLGDGMLAPATWGLMLSGFLGLGALMRRQRRLARAQA